MDLFHCDEPNQCQHIGFEYTALTSLQRKMDQTLGLTQFESGSEAASWAVFIAGMQSCCLLEVPTRATASDWVNDKPCDLLIGFLSYQVPTGVGSGEHPLSVAVGGGGKFFGVLWGNGLLMIEAQYPEERLWVDMTQGDLVARAQRARGSGIVPVSLPDHPCPCDMGVIEAWVSQCEQEMEDDEVTLTVMGDVEIPKGSTRFTTFAFCGWLDDGLVCVIGKEATNSKTVSKPSLGSSADSSIPGFVVAHVTPSGSSPRCQVLMHCEMRKLDAVLAKVVPAIKTNELGLSGKTTRYLNDTVFNEPMFWALLQSTDRGSGGEHLISPQLVLFGPPILSHPSVYCEPLLGVDQIEGLDRLYANVEVDELVENDTFHVGSERDAGG
eukprot:GHVN01061923.1.p2 GENE.GHVN01061923.1~~GHVN01061923.1.p2  ORF type:complete len:382 (+),score=66.13 GHVN01061923.1:2781-3926(+)